MGACSLAVLSSHWDLLEPASLPNCAQGRRWHSLSPILLTFDIQNSMHLKENVKNLCFWVAKGKGFPSCPLLQTKELLPNLSCWGRWEWLLLADLEWIWELPLWYQCNFSTPRTWRNTCPSNSAKLYAPILKRSPSDIPWFYFCPLCFSRFVCLMIALLSSFGFLPCAFRTGPSREAKRLSLHFLFHFCILADFSITSQAVAISFLCETWYAVLWHDIWVGDARGQPNLLVTSTDCRILHFARNSNAVEFMD